MTHPGPTVYLIRHGETDWNAEGRLQGGRDIPLNDVGRVQADEVGRRLMTLAPDFPDLDYVCSPLSRARETMEIMREVMGLHPATYRIDARLSELTFGSWEGFTWRDVQQKDSAGARAREADKWGYVPPSGESYAMLAERIRPWFEAIERDTVAVAHGGVIRALLAMTGAMGKAEAALADIWQGRILVFRRGAANWV